MSSTGAARAQHLLDLGRHAEARSLLAAALAATPDDARLHGLMCRTLLGLGRPREALEHANATVAAEPDGEWGHRLAAIVLLELRGPEGAAKAARTAVRLAPLQWETHQVLALAASELSGNGAESWRAARQAVALAPGQADAHFALGLVAQRCGDRDAARAAYEQTLAIEPDHPQALNNLVMVSRHRRLSHQARGYAGSLRADPQSAVSRHNAEMLGLKLSRRVYFAALASVALAAVVSGASAGRVGVASVSVVLLCLGGIAAYVAVEVRDVPSGLRRFIASRVVRDPLQLLTMLLAVAMLALAVITGLAPYGFAIALGLLPVLGLVNLGLVIVLRSRRRPR